MITICKEEMLATLRAFPDARLIEGSFGHKKLGHCAVGAIFADQLVADDWSGHLILSHALYGVDRDRRHENNWFGAVADTFNQEFQRHGPATAKAAALTAIRELLPDVAVIEALDPSPVAKAAVRGMRSAAVVATKKRRKRTAVTAS